MQNIRSIWGQISDVNVMKNYIDKARKKFNVRLLLYWGNRRMGIERNIGVGAYL